MQTEGKRLLVVDDDDAIRALLFTVLRRRGFAVDVARNGEEALERCESCRYAVVLLDLMMPRKSGYEVLRELERLPDHERPLAIVLTAGTPPTDLDPAIVAGSIRKPFDIQLLVDTVSGCMATTPSRSQPVGCPAPDSDTTSKGRSPN